MEQEINTETTEENSKVKEAETKTEEVIDEVKEELKKPGEISAEHLKALEEKLSARIDVLGSDGSKTKELEKQIDHLKNLLEGLVSAQEERERKHTDESTIVVPPKELDPPTHQNPVPVKNKENPSQAELKKKRRMGWW